jgi:hypothetical protein
MQFVLQPVYGHVKMECHYQCPATGQNVTTWKQRKELFAKHNLSDAASDMTAEQVISQAKRKKAENDALAQQMPHVDEHPELEISHVRNS